MSKIAENFVAIAEHICPICTKTHTHNTEILIHKNLRAIPDDKRVTGWGMCAEHDKLAKDDYVALVGCIGSKSKFLPNGNVHPDEVYRTGNIAHIKRSAWTKLFNLPISDDISYTFCEDDAIKMLKQITSEPT